MLNTIYYPHVTASVHLSFSLPFICWLHRITNHRNDFSQQTRKAHTGDIKWDESPFQCCFPLVLAETVDRCTELSSHVHQWLNNLFKFHYVIQHFWYNSSTTQSKKHFFCPSPITFQTRRYMSINEISNGLHKQPPNPEALGFGKLVLFFVNSLIFWRGRKSSRHKAHLPILPLFSLHSHCVPCTDRQVDAVWWLKLWPCCRITVR